jgi:hypothetical protein
LSDSGLVSRRIDGEALKRAKAFLLDYFVQLVLLHGNKQCFDTPKLRNLELVAVLSRKTFKRPTHPPLDVGQSLVQLHGVQQHIDGAQLAQLDLFNFRSYRQRFERSKPFVEHVCVVGVLTQRSQDTFEAAKLGCCFGSFCITPTTNETVG